MLYDVINGQTGLCLRVKVRQDNTGTKPGQGFTGLTSASSGLIVSTICDNEAAATAYTVAASHVQTIATLGTYAAPSASNCRIKEVDATNHPGLVELQIADARFAVANAKELTISIVGVTGMADCDVKIPLRSVNPYSTAFGLSLAKGTNITGLNDIAATAIVSGGAITTSSGAVSNVTTAATATNLTNAPTAGDFTTAMKASLNAATPASVTGAVGSVSGSVGSIAGVTFPANFGALGLTVGGKVSGVVLADTLTTYTGNTVQTGDNFARIGANGAGLSSIPYTGPSAATTAVAVRDVDNTSPAAGSLGAHVNSAASAGDPLSSAVPGSYSAGTAGYILGHAAQSGTMPTWFPSRFTNTTFASDGVFATAALANAPTGGGSAQTGDVFGLLNPLVATGAFTGASLANVPKTGYALSSTGLNAVAGVNGWSLPQAIRALVAFVTSKRTGVPASGSSGTVTFTSVSTGDYGTVTVDTSGNITANNMTPAA